MDLYDKITEKVNMIREKNIRPVSTEVAKIANSLYRELPKDDSEFINICNGLVITDEWIPYQVMTIWIKRRKSAYDMHFFDTYERWLFEHTKCWGACDQYCYRVLNPMMEKFPLLYDKAFEWAGSEKTYVKRAAAVCFIQSTKSFVINVPFEIVKKISDLLMQDSHIHVQKGVGWLLKYAYLTYPQQVEDYLRENVKNMSRTTFRYALEKMDEDLRENLMRL